MRPVHACLVCVAASALGALTGAYVLPDGRASIPPASPSSVVSPAAPTPATSSPTPASSPASTPTTTPTDASASPSPSPSPWATSRPDEGDLLSVRSFADESVPVVDGPYDGKVENDVDATACVDDDVHTTATLKKLTGHDAVLEGFWTRTDNGETARQLVAVADDPAGAQESVRRLLVAMEACQEAPPGHVVLGMASSVTYSATRSGSYVGLYTEKQNRSGRAPEDTQPCGGTVVARNGARFTAVNVYMCLDGAQLAGLAEAASERLG